MAYSRKGKARRTTKARRVRATPSRTRPVVFAVPKDETATGRYHEVAWARDGDLNAATRRGNVKRFRAWPKAKVFAMQKGKALGVLPLIHPY
jgi:hypothetical protein